MWPFTRPPLPTIRAEPTLPPRPARTLRLTDAALSMLPRDAAAPQATPWTIPKPPPGTAPQGAGMAMDREIADLYAYADQGSAAEGLVFLGYPYLAEMAQRAEYRIVAETFAKQMTRKWVRLHASGNKDRNERLTELRNAWDAMGVQAAIREALEHDGLFGRGQVLLDTGRLDDLDEMAAPLTLTPQKVGKGGFKGLKAVEPVWTYPGSYSATNPMRSDFYRPQIWYMQGKPVHATRLLGMVSRQVPDMLKPAYAFGGLSLSQMVQPSVNNWLKTRQDVSDLIESFSVQVLSTNMAAVSMQDGGGLDAIGAIGMQGLVNRVEMFTRFARNRGVFMVDKDSEAFSNVSAPLGTLDHLQAQAQEHIASAAGIPLVILLGITPSGLNASSDGEIRAFYDRVRGMQEAVVRPVLQTVLTLTQLSLWGEVDPAIGFDFEPLWEQSEVERSTIRQTNAATAVTYIEASVISNEEERARLAREDGGLWDGLDLSEPLAAEPEDDGGMDLLRAALGEPAAAA